MKFYAGIGSRVTPPAILELMRTLAGSLESNGYTLRSGGANGADEAFESGVESLGSTQIFLPWARFNGNRSRLSLDRMKDQIVQRAYTIAAEHHPAWNRCSQAARKMHARNVMQILGPDLETPSEFVICWTKSGKPEGGTGEALRIAHTFKIPEYNLRNESDREALYRNFDWSGTVIGDFLLK